MFYNRFDKCLLAAWPGECTIVLANPHLAPSTGNYVNYDFYVNQVSGLFDMVYKDNSVKTKYHQYFYSMYYENGAWQTRKHLYLHVIVGDENLKFEYVTSLPKNGCGQCAEERLSLEQNCGSEANILFWNDSTCVGMCRGNNLGGDCGG